MNDGITPVRLRIMNRARTLMEAEYAQHGEVKLSDVAGMVRDELMNDDGFLQEAVAMMVYRVAYEAVIGISRGSRDLRVVHDTVVSPVQQREVKASRWETWLERVGERHLLLMDMTRDDLFKAAQAREGRARTELSTAVFFKAIGAKLDGDQTVGSRFDSDELLLLWDQINVRIRGEGAVA